MAASMLVRNGLPLTHKIAAPSVRPAKAQRAGRLVVRAEEEAKEANTGQAADENKQGTQDSKVQKVDRSKDNLFFASEQSLSYLDGSLPADYGFDPLGLSDPEGAGGFIDPKWLAYSEVIHARWAMLGAAGIIAPEILSNAGVIPQSPQDVLWWKTGLIPPLGNYKDGYWMDPFSLFWIEVILVQFAELKRWQDYRHPGSQGEQYFLGLEQALKGSGDAKYPGGQFFNVFNLGKTDAELQNLKTKELKNGRLAMLAVFGYGAQAIITGQGPFQNLKDHLADPFGHNLVTNLSFQVGGL
jgi:light-harvesting complex I chlorophyll a/b binding protein 3